MIRKISLSERIFEVVNVVFISLIIIVTLYPIIHVLFASLSNPNLLIRHKGLILWPVGFSFGAYREVFLNPMILLGYRNTLLYLTLGTSLNVLLTCVGAYVLSRKGVYWRNALMMFCVFTMFFSGGLIPLYITVKNLGLYNTIGAVIFPPAINTFNLIVTRTFFLAIPDSLSESAKIDGATDFVILFRVIVPLAMPVIAVILLFYGVERWNAWFFAMIFLSKREMHPLQLVLREILIANILDNMTTSVPSGDKEALGMTVKYATIIVATVPVLCIYPFLQKYFIKGVMVGAIKG